jgi:hypothetical protein
VIEATSPDQTARGLLHIAVGFFLAGEEERASGLIDDAAEAAPALVPQLLSELADFVAEQGTLAPLVGTLAAAASPPVDDEVAPS